MVTAWESADSEKVRNFAAVVGKLAIDKRDSLDAYRDSQGKLTINKLQQTYARRSPLLAISLIVSDNFSKDLMNWITETPPEKHFNKTFFPVLLSLEDMRLHYFRKSNLLSSHYYHGIESYVEELLGWI